MTLRTALIAFGVLVGILLIVLLGKNALVAVAGLGAAAAASQRVRKARQGATRTRAAEAAQPGKDEILDTAVLEAAEKAAEEARNAPLGDDEDPTAAGREWLDER